jgi:hypothetical protein
VANAGLSQGQIGTSNSKTVVGIAAKPPNCEFNTNNMINLDQLHHSKIIWYSYLCFFNHFDSIPYQWQMLASARVK